MRAWRLRDTLFPPFDWSACSQFRAGVLIGSLSKDVFGRRTSTGSDASSLLICLDATRCVLLSIFTLVETIFQKTGQNRCRRMLNVHFLLTCIAQEKRPCLSSLLFSSRRSFHRCSWRGSRPIPSLEGIPSVTLGRPGPTCH